MNKKDIILVYKCGCTWKQIYPQKILEKEAKEAREAAIKIQCPLCKEKNA